MQSVRERADVVVVTGGDENVFPPPRDLSPGRVTDGLGCPIHRRRSVVSAGPICQRQSARGTPGASQPPWGPKGRPRRRPQRRPEWVGVMASSRSVLTPAQLLAPFTILKIPESVAQVLVFEARFQPLQRFLKFQSLPNPDLLSWIATQVWRAG